MTAVGVNVSDWLVTGQHGRFVTEGEEQAAGGQHTKDEQDKRGELTM